jgi:hypothetical protein
VEIEYGKKQTNSRKYEELVLKDELLVKLSDFYEQNLICGSCGATMRLKYVSAPAFVAICPCGKTYGFNDVRAKVIKEL